MNRPSGGWTPAPEAAAAKLQAVHARLTTAIADLTQQAGWQQMLQTAARFHHYSPNNVLLIASQCPDASAVAGFGIWKQLGRQVRKGQTGIAILAPVPHRPGTDRGHTDRSHTDRSDTDRSDPPARTPGAEPAIGFAGPSPTTQPTGAGSMESSQGSDSSQSLQGRRISGFRVVHVFDLSQTDGPDLPTGPVPQLLDGAAPPGLYDGLAQQVRQEGFQLLRHDLDIPHLGSLAGAGSRRPNGVTDYFARTVIVRPDLSEAQASKTLAHELGHVLLHRPQSRPAVLDRPRAEIEAESVAYLVTAAHGLAADDYTVPYVTGWSGGDLSVVQQSAERVLTAAQHILQRTPPPPAFSRPQPAGADRHLQRTSSHDASREGGRSASRDTSRDVSRDVGRDRERVAGRSALVSQHLDDRAPAVTAPNGPVRDSRATDQGRLW